jgi:hypothetical protein
MPDSISIDRSAGFSVHRNQDVFIETVLVKRLGEKRTLLPFGPVFTNADTLPRTLPAEQTSHSIAACGLKDFWATEASFRWVMTAYHLLMSTLNT